MKPSSYCLHCSWHMESANRDYLDMLNARHMSRYEGHVVVTYYK